MPPTIHPPCLLGGTRCTWCNKTGTDLSPKRAEALANGAERDVVYMVYQAVYHKTTSAKSSTSADAVSVTCLPHGENRHCHAAILFVPFDVAADAGGLRWPLKSQEGPSGPA